MLSKSIKLYHADCLDVMPDLPSGKIQLILCDLPFGTTASNWDKAIPAEKLWEQYDRLIAPNGSVVLFASGLFMPYLISSNIKNYKYLWVWVKRNATNFVHAKNRPLCACEFLLVFSKAPMGHISQLGDKRMMYNPQGLIPCHKEIKQGKGRFGTNAGVRPSQLNENDTFTREWTNYPKDVLLDFKDLPPNKKLHTNEKPVDLLEYMIKTYSNEGDIVMDNCMGSGSCGEACLKTNRKFLGIEKEEVYYNISKKRLEDLCQ